MSESRFCTVVSLREIGDEFYEESIDVSGRICHWAANRIERLTKEIEILKEEND